MNKHIVLFLICFFPAILWAQKNKKVNYAFSNLDGHIHVDGNLREWEGRLQEVAGDLWSYAVIEQNKELFVAIVVKDVQLQREALRGGLFVNVNYDDKKKDGARLYFPYWDRERKRALMNDEELPQHNFEKALLEKVNGYLLMGFSRVRDGILALDNDYNIEAKALIDSNKCLVFEARIPLDLVGLKTDLLAVQLGVNTQYMMMKKALDSRRGDPHAGMPGRMPSSNLKNPFKGETQIWVIDKKSK